MTILVVDDEKNIRESLVKLLTHAGFEAEAAENGLSAQRRLQERAFDAVVADLKMPGLDGAGLLHWCRTEGPDPAFVLISAHGEIDDAVQAMKNGARDYLSKPFDPDELILRLKAAVQLHQSTRLLQARAPETAAGGGHLSPAFAKINGLIEKAAKTPSLILISGESGTGKEVLARRIHQLSPWADGPFVPINIGGVPETLLESELFGYEKGAFTGADKRKPGLFELACGGTLFLDEIGELPLALQVKLLRVLQDRKIMRLGGTVPIPVEARLVAATNRDLAAEVKKGTFREDLFYRLNVVPVRLPALRERLEDLPRLVEEILARQRPRVGSKVEGLTPDGWAALRGYSFPGNIRELENLLERALIFCENGQLSALDLGLPPPEGPTETEDPEPAGGGTLRELERVAITNTLLKWEGNQSKAAAELGISRRTLFTKIREYGLEKTS